MLLEAVRSSQQEWPLLHEGIVEFASEWRLAPVSPMPVMLHDMRLVGVPEKDGLYRV